MDGVLDTVSSIDNRSCIRDSCDLPMFENSKALFVLVSFDRAIYDRLVAKYHIIDPAFGQFVDQYTFLRMPGAAMAKKKVHLSKFRGCPEIQHW